MRVVALALAGAAVALVLTALRADTYAAEALVAVQGPRADERPQASAVVQAEGYAQLVSSEGFLEGARAQLAGGRLDAAELDERVDARRRPGTALVAIEAEGESPAAARGLATDVAGALVSFVQQQARQRAVQVEDELRQRIEDAADDEERRAFQDELARQVSRTVEAATGVVVAARPAEPREPLGKPWLRDLLLGLLAGAAAGLALALVRKPRLPRRRPRPAAAPAAVAPLEQAVERPAAAPAAAPPQVRIVAPEPGSHLTGVVALRADAHAGAGIAAVRFLVSTGGTDWALLDGEVWDTSGIPEGRYWLSAVATDTAGNSAASEPLPVTVG